MKYLKIVLFPYPFSRWLHSIVLKNLGWSFICSWFFAAISIQRVWAVPYFLQILGIIYVRFVYFAAIAQVWINLHWQHLFYTLMLWKGSQVPCSLGNISKRTKKKPWRKRQSRSWRFSFYKYFTTFFLFISFFQLVYFIFFLKYFFLPTPTTHDPRPRPTTSTHDLYPLPTTRDI